METLIIISLGLLIGFWWSSVSAYEVAYKEAKKTCFQLDLQFLDDTLESIKIRPCRHPRGYMQWCRLYEFEFSSDGENRYKGFIRLSGRKLESIDMDAYRVGET